MKQFALLQYNFKVMMLHNKWLIVFPLVVSQLAVFWLLSTREFTLDLPAQCVEMITPLLGAFLGAHLLAAEYRSRVGALLASRPVNISKIVVLRLLVMLAFIFFLAGLTLTAFYFAKEPYTIWPNLVACIPSTLFLTLLGLTFATLFRHSLAGFGASALYWMFDLVPGAPLNPYLSLKSLSSFYAALHIPDRQTFLNEWWISKILLCLLAGLLYLYHNRIVFSLGAPQSLRLRRRAAFVALSIPILYLFSGAALRMSYGYSHRGALPPNDLAWFRYQFASYGPVPMASLFGGDFTRYIGQNSTLWRLSEEDEADLMGDNIKHKNDLHQLLQKNPNSPWAPSASEAIARLEAHLEKQTDPALLYFRQITDRYPSSPYIDYALFQVALTLAEAGKKEEAHKTYTELLQRVPNSVHRSEALKFQIDYARSQGKLDEAEKMAVLWSSSAPLLDRFQSYFLLAQIRKEAKNLNGAKQAAKEMMTSLHDYQEAISNRTLVLLPNARKIRDQDAALAQAFYHELK